MKLPLDIPDHLLEPAHALHSIDSILREFVTRDMELTALLEDAERHGDGEQAIFLNAKREVFNDWQILISALADALRANLKENAR